MVIDTYVLLAYATIWTVFYWFLSQYIAELSRRKWTTWVQSAESDEVLLEALEAIINEIEDRMHEKLQHFQDSFFGSVGQMTKRAKELDPMNNIRKAAKSGDWPSLMIEYMANKANLGHLIGNESPKDAINEGVTGQNIPLKPKKINDLLNK
jgi:hypothetical protein